jgi:hypothetical protein
MHQNRSSSADWPTIQEYADRRGVSAKTIRRLIERGLIPAYRRASPLMACRASACEPSALTHVNRCAPGRSSDARSGGTVQAGRGVADCRPAWYRPRVRAALAGLAAMSVVSNAQSRRHKQTAQAVRGSQAIGPAGRGTKDPGERPVGAAGS